MYACEELSFCLTGGRTEEKNNYIILYVFILILFGGSWCGHKQLTKVILQFSSRQYRTR